MRTLNDRLVELGEIIQRRDFLAKKGNANEVPYYIFDYPPQKALEVQQSIRLLQESMNKKDNGAHMFIFDIYDIAMEFFEDEDYIDQFEELEEDEGFDSLVEAITNALELTNEDGDNYITRYIVDQVAAQPYDYPVVFITGIGKCFPIIRSHFILNFLHQNFSDVPVIAMYPGDYDGQHLRPFGTIASENYYRAFKLVP